MDFDPVAYINTPRWQTSRLGLERTHELLERLGRPQDALRFVHVAGTNGKGSVCAYLASALTAAGYRTGLFTSPYIERFEERIRVDGVDISREELLSATLAVRDHASAMEAETGDHPTEFELMTAVAMEHFRAARCDIVVLEVGLGGRLDSTNVIEGPEACVITRIGLDHTALLGNTLAEVAGEKAGIIKPGAPVVSWPQEPPAMEVVERAAAERGCELHVPRLDDADLSVGGIMRREDAAGRPCLVRPFAYGGVPFETRLLGSYQPANAALAIETLCVLRERGWHLPDEALHEGIAAARWPGRFEVVAHDPLVIVDGGHNPQGAAALADSLADLLGGAGVGNVVFVMGALADKDCEGMIRAVLPNAHAFFTYAPGNPRALSAADLADAIRHVAAEEGAPLDGGVEPCSSPREAIVRARQLVAQEAAGQVQALVAFGSLYSIAEIKAALAK